MRDHGSWSVSIGRFGGLNVRVHMVFLLFAAFALYLGWRQQQIPGEGGDLSTAALSLGILLVSVLLHELGHYQAAVRLGGGGDRIVLGPLGGLAPLRLPPDPQAELMAYLAGPLVNGLVCLVCIPLMLARGEADLANLLHPLTPPVSGESIASELLPLTFWVNWVLLLVNFTPVFPFDGGRAVRASLLLMWPNLSRRGAAIAVARFAKVTAAVLLILACFLPARGVSDTLPPWFVLVLLAIVLFFSAKHEEDRRDEQEREEELFGYDFSQGYTSLEQSHDPPRSEQGPITRWRRRRQEAKQQRRREIEAEEERRVDEILSRLYESGMESLSESDRVLLKRVSQRYRNRLGPRA